MKRLLKVNDVFSFNDKRRPGNYLVVSAEMAGGGDGHGPGDYYPDEHEVTAWRVAPNGVLSNKKVRFFQTGCYSGLVPPSSVAFVGKAKTKTTVVSLKK